MSQAARLTPEALEAAARDAYRRNFQTRASAAPLRKVIEDMLASGGNLTRLKLALLAGNVTHLPTGATEALATAFEYFHTASLLFDDLPCMDNATERRGRLCAHRQHGEAAAVLGALAFVNRAYALLWEALDAAPEPNRARAAAHAERCLGDAGVLDGQCLDLDFRSSDGSPRAVARVALGKTVALLRLSLVTPALIAGANRQELLLLDRLSVYWGLAYQIADDCSDISSEATSGKTSGRDAFLGHPNFALAAGAVDTVHRLGRLFSQLETTLSRLVCIRTAWTALGPLVTRLVQTTSIAQVATDESARQCA